MMDILFVLMMGVLLNVESTGETRAVGNGTWKAACEKGEVTGLSYNGKSLVTELGEFRVAGRDVRSFREVAELREQDRDRIVYEGISDDGERMYVEFGQVITVGHNFEFMLFTSWLPPSQYPADAVTGLLRFSPQVSAVKQIPIKHDKPVIPGTVDFAVQIKGGGRLRLRVIGVNAHKLYLKPERGCWVLRFEETRDYVSDVLAKSHGSRHLSYWIASTDTHYVKFIFLPEKDRP